MTNIIADQFQSTLDFTNNCSFIPYVSPSPASEPETVAPGATIQQQLEALIDQLYWWHYSKPDTAVYDKASDSLTQILCTAPHGWLPFHEQTSVVECFQSIFDVFERDVLRSAISQWVLDPFQSSADHPLQSIRAHRLVYSMLIRQQDLISDLELQFRVAKIIQRYQALRPFHLIVHDRSRPHTEFPPFAFMYELPSLRSFCPSSIDQALVQAVDDYRQNILRGPPSSLSVGC